MTRIPKGADLILNRVSGAPGTDGMLGEWASHADLHGKNAVGLMVRRERVQLLETIERSRQIYGPVGARYREPQRRTPSRLLLEIDVGQRLTVAVTDDEGNGAYPTSGTLLVRATGTGTNGRLIASY